MNLIPILFHIEPFFRSSPPYQVPPGHRVCPAPTEGDGGGSEGSKALYLKEIINYLGALSLGINFLTARLTESDEAEVGPRNSDPAKNNAYKLYVSMQFNFRRGMR